MGLLRPATDMAAATAMVATVVDTATVTARGPLMPSPATAMAADTAMAATVDMATATARGLLSPATATTAMVATAAAMAVTTVSYHRIRRSELSLKQNSQK